MCGAQPARSMLACQWKRTSSPLVGHSVGSSLRIGASIHQVNGERMSYQLGTLADAHLGHALVPTLDHLRERPVTVTQGRSHKLSLSDPHCQLGLQMQTVSSCHRSHHRPACLALADLELERVVTVPAGVELLAIGKGACDRI